MLTLNPVQKEVATASYSILWSKDLLYIYIADETGAYATGNTGGYGSPNPTVNVNNSFFRIWLPKAEDSNYVDIVIDNTNFGFSAVDFATIGNALQAKLTSALLGLTAGDKLADGIYTLTYFVFYTGASTIASNTAYTITLTSSADAAYLGEGAYIKTNGGVTYDIESVAGSVLTLPSNTGFAVNALASMSYTYGFSTQIKLFMAGNGLQCYVQNAPQMTTACCKSCGKDLLLDLLEFKGYLDSAESNWANGSYTESQEIIDTISSFCATEGELTICSSCQTC